MSEFKFITFVVGGTEYAVNIDDIVAIQEMQKITPIPFQKDYIDGIIDFRHQLVIPVLNMSKFLGIYQENDNGKLIIVKHDNRNIAIQVEKLKKIISVAHDDIKANPVKSKLVETIVNYEDGIVSILNLSELIK